ncbi:MAG: hypothetical protein MUO91_01985 [candidate division Zixibacteria bacterium]|nr:hypothetical protein [candidate division Zixibacteria bacterium]
MKVSVKNFAVTMELKNKGIEFDVCDNSGNHLGDLVVTKAKLIWCKGKTTSVKGIEIKWDDFKSYMESRQHI